MSDAELRDRLMRLETFTGVNDPEAGLRGEIKQTREDVRGIYERMRAMELRGYTIAGGGIAVIWLIQNLLR